MDISRINYWSGIDNSEQPIRIGIPETDLKSVSECTSSPKLTGMKQQDENRTALVVHDNIIFWSMHNKECWYRMLKRGLRYGYT